LEATVLAGYLEEENALRRRVLRQPKRVLERGRVQSPSFLLAVGKKRARAATLLQSKGKGPRWKKEKDTTHMKGLW